MNLNPTTIGKEGIEIKNIEESFCKSIEKEDVDKGNILSEIARKVVKDSLRVKKGEFFLISCGDDLYYKFCEAVAIQAINVGAYPLIVMGSDRLTLESFKQPMEYFQGLPRFGLALMDIIDVELKVGFVRDPGIFTTAKPEILSALSRKGEPVKKRMYERNKEQVQVRMASFVHPTPESARFYGLSEKEYEDLVWSAMNIDYPALRKRARAIADLMKGGDRVYITNPQGTDISFSIKDRLLYIDDGIFDESPLNDGIFMMNLPTGEICVAPIEDSAEGTAVFEYNLFFGEELKNLQLTFSKGKIIDIKADKGAEKYREVLEKNSGNKDGIAELGIGLNPNVNRVTGNLALDEKIVGTIHIATGENRMMGGNSSSSFHWDLVMQKPTLAVDGRVIIKEGEYMV